MTVAFVVPPGALPFASRLAAEFAPDTIVAVSFAALADKLPTIEGVVTGTTLYDHAAVELLRAKAPRLRWVQALSSGVDHHLAAGLPAGVTLTSATGAHAPAVADHALALALSLLRGLPRFRAVAATQSWLKPPQMPKLRTLHRARCLVLGHGAIGRAIVQRLIGFEAQVTVASRTPVPLADGVRHCPLDDLDGALPTTDLVFLCLPDAPGTTGSSRGRVSSRCRRARWLSISVAAA